MEKLTVYTCECGNQSWIITGDKFICARCNKYHSVFKNTINSAEDFNRLRTTYGEVKEDAPKQLET